MNHKPPPELPAEITHAFIDSALTAFQELVQQNMVYVDPVRPPIQSDYVVATVRLLRNTPGTLTLVLDALSARRLAECYLPRGSMLSDEMINDVAAEFANVIAGQAKTILKGTPYHFTLSIPEVKREKQWLSTSDSAHCMCIATLQFEGSQLRLFLDLSPCPGA